MTAAIALAARLLGAAAMLAASAAASGEKTWEEEALPTGLTETHAAVVSVSMGICAVALLAMAVWAAVSGKGVRLSYLVIGVAGAAIATVGVVAWVVTYVEARDVIHEKSERLMTQTAEMIEAVVMELEAGPELLTAMQMMHLTRHVDWVDAFPNPWRGLMALDRSMPRESIDLVYMGLPDGRIQGVTDRGDGRFLIGMTSDPVVQQDFVAACPGVKCMPRDYGNCENVSAPCDAEAMVQCESTCGVPASQALCFPPENKTRLMPLGKPWVDEYTVDCANKTLRTVPYDVRERPWYKLVANESTAAAVTWTRPYLFSSSQADGRRDLGFTAVLRQSGVGVFAVDYKFGRMNSILANSLPTPNARILLVSPAWDLLSASASAEDLKAELGESAMTKVFNLATDAPHDSEMRRMVEVVAGRFGSLPAAMGRRSLLVEGDALIAVLGLEVTGGFEALTVLYLPYSDLLGATNRASTMALVLVVCICLVFVMVLAAVLHFTLMPLRGLAEGMELIAWMKLSKVGVLQRSCVYELQWMEKSFEKMVNNLEEFRQFLPSSVLETDTAETDAISDDEEDDEIFVTTEGHAALVFTDVVKSSDSWEKCPKDMRVGLRKHNDVMRRLIAEHGGYEVKTVGDSFMVSFEGETAALRSVRFALKAQEQLREQEWPAPLLALPQNAKTENGAWNGIRVRIGVHVGDVDIETNKDTGRKDYFGPMVNKASRMESNGVAGGVCITDEVKAAVESSEEFKNHSLMPMGAIDLKGIGMTTCQLLISPVLEDRRADYTQFITVKANSSAAAGKTGKFEQNKNHGTKSETSSFHTTGGARGRAQGAERFASRLDRIANVTAGMIELRTPTGFLDDWTDPLGAINEAMSCIFVMLRRTHGAISSVVGSGIAVNWGAVKRDRGTTSFNNAFKFGRLLRCLHANDKSAKPYFGMCVGPVVHGSVGVGQKFVTTIGPAVSLATHLAQVAADIRAPFLGTSLVGDFVSYGSNVRHNVRPIDVWSVALPHQAFTVYEVASKGEKSISFRNSTSMRGALERETSCTSHVSARADANITPGLSPGKLSFGLGDIPRTVSSPGWAPTPGSPSGLESANDGAWGWGEGYWEAFLAKDFNVIKLHCNADLDPVGFGVGDRGAHPLRAPFQENSL
eukprot:TRINITY_DN6892_c0_g4_i3.p1 TRINITY_DN6892_c0_g4~~TRINITY_DN6892_c0_g4_i3.p1  ORF type:complete len:1145 (+),score=370.65 TRINITY_DN6892_c0_g4_i3:74-3508(+)